MPRLQVHLDGLAIGWLVSLGNNRLSFEYNDAYREDPSATPLSVSMPLTAREHPDTRVTPYLWNLLPDSETVLARWAQEFHVSQTNVFALLSNIDDLPGSVRFITEEKTTETESDRIDWINDDEVAHRLATLRQDQAAWRGHPGTGQWSLPGAQAKIALLHDAGSWGVPHGNVPTNRILKPAIPGLTDHDLNEHLCLRTMAGLGLPVATTAIATFGEERAIVIERYDRYQDANGTWRRLHQEDMCQALNVRPQFKYESDGGPGIPAIAELLTNTLPVTDAARTVAEFIAAIAFNWIIAGTDAHAKNYALLLRGRDVALAPFYDVASLLPYDAHLPKVRLAMRVDTENRLTRIMREHWERLARTCKLSRDDVVNLVRVIAEQTPATMAAAAADPAIVALGSPLPDRLLALVQDRAQDCVRRMELAPRV